MRILKQQPLRRQVVVAVSAVLLPLIVVGAWASNRTWVERQAEVRGEAVSVATTAAAYLDEYLKGLDVLASVLVRHPAVLALDGPAADRLFATVLQDQPLLTNLLLVAPDESIHGSALPVQDGRASHSWLSQVLKTSKPQVGEFEIGRVSGKPTAPFAYPVLDGTSAVIAVLDLRVDLTQLQRVFADIPLPTGSVVTVVDRTNRVLVRSVDSEEFVGAIGPAIERSGLPRSDERIDLDGVERLNGDANVQHAPWVVSVGIPSAVVAARLVPLWRRNLSIVFGALAVSLLLALWLAHLMSRQLSNLRLAVQRIADGDLSPPQPHEVSNFELAELQGAFITMAASLRQAHSALDHQVGQERKMNEALKLLQRQVVRQERLAAVGLLASGVAHELNNPLQAILGAAELLERQPGLTAEVRDEIKFVKAQSGRAREVIRSLSRFSSLQIGPPSPIDLTDVIAEVLQLRASDLESSTLTVEVHTMSRRKVFANFTELEQVTLNFVLNAQQAIASQHYGTGNGRIEIQLSDVGQRVRLEVHDNGPGVAINHEPKLFQPFFTTKDIGQGTGLGLSVSYGIIDSYGGEVGYFRNQSGGATFFFELPAIDPSYDGADLPPMPSSNTVAREPSLDGPAVLRRPV